MPGETSGLDRMLRPGGGTLVATEFLANAALIPVAIALATLLARAPATWPLIVPLLSGAFLQALLVGRGLAAGRQPGLLVNLVGPGLYAACVAAADPVALVEDGFVAVYWATALAVGLCRAAARRAAGTAAEALLVSQHIVRTLGVVAVYAVIEGDPAVFLADTGHRFLAIGGLLLGATLGAAAVVHRRDRERLHDIAGRLQGYSELLLGRTNLHRAIGREDELKPRRSRRSVLFADVRGFTRWSESRRPEEVLALLDGVYAAAERAAGPHAPIRAKHTGDEVMLFFAEPLAAARAALALRDEVGAVLTPFGLHIGVGLHHGEVIEGLFGAVRTKAYDILGDTVNTAKRVSDHARPGSIIVTFSFYEACRGRVRILGDQRIAAKGKTDPVLVAELVGVDDGPSQG